MSEVGGQRSETASASLTSGLRPLASVLEIVRLCCGMASLALAWCVLTVVLMLPERKRSEVRSQRSDKTSSSLTSDLRPLTSSPPP